MDKIRVLILASDPFKRNALSIDAEVRAIAAKIRSAEHRDRIELIQGWAVRPDDLQEKLLQHKPHVVHFSGHGTKAAELILQDQNGKPQLVTMNALVGLMKVLKDNIRVVLMNICHSRAQAEAIAQILDCAIGMNADIGDDAAIIFAAAFYQALGFGRNVLTAFEMGKNALQLANIPEEDTPEIFTRSGINASKVILINP